MSRVESVEKGKMDDKATKSNAAKKDDGHVVNEDIVYICKNGSPQDFKLDSSGAVVGLKSFEDILDMLGPYGRWNVLLFCTVTVVSLILPFQSLTYEFLGSTPDYWCLVDDLVQANWTQEQIYNLAIPHSNNSLEKGCTYFTYDYKKAVELGYETVIQNPDLISTGSNSTASCKSRYFNISDYSATLVAEWDLVCERRWLYSTTQSISQFGILFGVLFSGYLMDTYGRRPVIIIAVGLSTLSGFGAALAPIFPLYLLAKMLVSCFNYSFGTGTFIYQMEIFSPDQRSSLGSLGGLPWSLGYMIVPWIAYGFSSWRWLQFTYSLPTVLFLSYYWLIPESPRWLLSEGRYEEAAEVVIKAAKVNGRTFPPKEALLASLKKMIQLKEKKPKEALGRRIIMTAKHFLILVMKSEFRRKILISYFCWFSVSMVYYGIALNSGNLSTDKYMYVFLGGLAEIPAYFITWAMLSKLGRRLTLSINYVVCGVCIAIIAILMIMMEQVPNGLLVFLSLIGKTSISCSFIVVYVQTAELFPTRYRSLAVGESSMCARVGSILSPYINDILGEHITWSPSALFALMSVLAAALALLQPETRDSITEDSPDEADDEAPAEGEKRPADTVSQAKYGTTNEAFQGE